MKKILLSIIALSFLMSEIQFNGDARFRPRYDIKEKWVLGHSDISPGRKLDPGEKFDWESIRKIFK